MRISEAFDVYKTEYMLIKGISHRVLENNDYVKRRMVEIVGDKQINKLTLQDVSQWVQGITIRVLPDGAIAPRMQNTVRNDVVRLRAVLRYAKLRGIDCLNYELIPIPKPEDSERCYLTASEVARMVKCAYSLRNKVVISLLYSSGIRLSEMLALDRTSITNRRFTVIGKGKKERLCFIDERTERLIKEYLASRHDNCQALIISELNKARMTPTNVQLLIRNSAKRAGINKNVTPHVLRHSFATNFIANNGNIRVLSTLLGHTNVSTTMIYTHVVDNELESYYRAFHSVIDPKPVEKSKHLLIDKSTLVVYN
jgi:site-specific recombinase XerD